MTTQLTLISVPAQAASADDGAHDADRHPASPTDDVAAPPTPAGIPRPAVGAVGPAPRRSAAYDGWLDGPTINTGRKGVAAARAALADANQRVASRREQADAAREERLAEQAATVRRPTPHAA